MTTPDYDKIYRIHKDKLLRISDQLTALAGTPEYRSASSGNVQVLREQLKVLYTTEILRPHYADDYIVFVAIETDIEDAKAILEVTTHLPELLLLPTNHEDQNTVLGAVFKELQTVDGNQDSDEYPKTVALVMRVIDMLQDTGQLVNSLRVVEDANDLVHALYDSSLVDYVLNLVDPEELVSALEITDSSTVLSNAIIERGNDHTSIESRVSSAISIIKRMSLDNRRHREFLSTKKLHAYGHSATYLHLLTDKTIDFGRVLLEFLDDNELFVNLMSHKNSEGMTPLASSYLNQNPAVFKAFLTRMSTIDKVVDDETGLAVQGSLYEKLINLFGAEDNSFEQGESIMYAMTRNYEESLEFWAIMAQTGWIRREVFSDEVPWTVMNVRVPEDFTYWGYIKSVPGIAAYIPNLSKGVM